MKRGRSVSGDRVTGGGRVRARAERNNSRVSVGSRGRVWRAACVERPPGPGGWNHCIARLEPSHVSARREAARGGRDRPEPGAHRGLSASARETRLQLQHRIGQSSIVSELAPGIARAQEVLVSGGVVARASAHVLWTMELRAVR
ncbi:unnamed protein product [Urochloa humidicola]